MSNDPEPEEKIFNVDMDKSIHKRFVLDRESGALRELTDGELQDGGPVHGEIKLGLPPKSIRDLFEVLVVSEILDEVRMIRRALEKSPLFMVVPVSRDVDVQSVADALETLHADVVAHMHQEAAKDETRPRSELPE